HERSHGAAGGHCRRQHSTDRHEYGQDRGWCIRVVAEPIGLPTNDMRCQPIWRWRGGAADCDAHTRLSCVRPHRPRAPCNLHGQVTMRILVLVTSYPSDEEHYAMFLHVRVAAYQRRGQEVRVVSCFRPNEVYEFGGVAVHCVSDVEGLVTQ